MKNKVAVAILLSTSLVSLDAAASNIMAFSSQFQAASGINDRDIEMGKVKNNVMNFLNIELVKTLMDIEDNLYKVTEDFSYDFFKNNNFTSIFKNTLALETSILKLIDQDLVTKIEVKNPLRLILSIKNKIARIDQISDSLDLVPSYYDAKINPVHLKNLADNTNNKLLDQIRNKA